MLAGFNVYSPRPGSRIISNVRTSGEQSLPQTQQKARPKSTPRAPAHPNDVLMLVRPHRPLYFCLDFLLGRPLARSRHRWLPCRIWVYIRL